MELVYLPHKDSARKDGCPSPLLQTRHLKFAWAAAGCLGKSTRGLLPSLQNSSTKAWEEFSHLRYLAFTNFSSQTCSGDTENIATGMSALCYLSFGFVLRVLFVKGEWDRKSTVQGAKGREDRNFQQVSCKEMVPRTGFPLKEMPARILSRYSPCVVATAKSVSLLLAGALIHSSLHG